MSEIAELFKALSDFGRLRIVRLLASHGELCACQLSKDLQLSAATLSRHMAQLQQAGLVQSRRDGRWVHYSLAGSSALSTALLQWLQMHAEPCTLRPGNSADSSCTLTD